MWICINTMKKYLITLTIILASIWFGLTSLMNSAMANDYNKAVIGHIIQTKVNGDNADVSKLLEYEMDIRVQVQVLKQALQINEKTSLKGILHLTLITLIIFNLTLLVPFEGR